MHALADSRRGRSGLEDEMDDEDNDVYDEGQDNDFDEDDNVGEDFADSDEGSVTCEPYQQQLRRRS